MIKINLGDNLYEVIKNERDGFVLEEIKNRFTSYFEDFDYILGDWAYGKLRLKGFNNPSNKNFKKINDFKNIDNYIKDNCAYGCKYFILKKINDCKNDKI